MSRTEKIEKQLGDAREAAQRAATTLAAENARLEIAKQDQLDAMIASDLGENGSAGRLRAAEQRIKDATEAISRASDEAAVKAAVAARLESVLRDQRIADNQASRLQHAEALLRDGRKVRKALEQLADLLSQAQGHVDAIRESEREMAAANPGRFVQKIHASLPVETDIETALKRLRVWETEIEQALGYATDEAFQPAAVVKADGKTGSVPQTTVTRDIPMFPGEPYAPAPGGVWEAV